MNSEKDIFTKIKEIELTNNYREKSIIATKVAEFVKDGDIIGFGSGSTSFIAVQKIANKIKMNNIKIKAVPTSKEIEELCKYYEIEISNLNEVELDWAFDGADEVDKNNNMIKGQGGAMFKEKLNILNSPKTYILIDKSKSVNYLGENYPIPVECYPGAIKYIEEQFKQNNSIISYTLRNNNGKIIVTDSGNYIIDIKCQNINKELQKFLKNITGVIETGLFIGFENIEFLK